MEKIERQHLKDTETFKGLIEYKFNPIKEELCDKLNIKKSIPLTVLEFSRNKKRGVLIHTYYDAMRDREDGGLYLEPKKITIHLLGIYKFINKFHIESITPELFIKVVEVILTHQLFHMHLFNKENAKKYRNEITGKINIDTLDTEKVCFTKVEEYYTKKGDFAALLLLEALWLAYRCDSEQISRDRFKYESRIMKYSFIEANKKLLEEKYLE